MEYKLQSNLKALGFLVAKGEFKDSRRIKDLVDDYSYLKELYVALGNEAVFDILIRSELKLVKNLKFLFKFGLFLIRRRCFSALCPFKRRFTISYQENKRA